MGELQLHEIVVAYYTNHGHIYEDMLYYYDYKSFNTSMKNIQHREHFDFWTTKALIKLNKILTDLELKEKLTKFVSE